MHIQASIKLAAAAAALATGLSIGTAGVATAASATPRPTAVEYGSSASSAGRSGAVTPDVNNFWTYEDSGQNPSGGDEAYACVKGFDYLRANGWIIQNPVKSVKNNCEYRVYLQYANGTSDCVNPGASRDVVESSNQNPDGVMIGNSTAQC